MQYFDINVAPTDAKVLNVKGNYIYFLSGSAGGADNTIAVRPGAGSDVALLKPGQALRLAEGSDSTQWIISNYAKQGTIIGQVLIGEGEFSDNRISGSVEIIDGNKSRVIAGMAFCGLAYQSAVAAAYARCQLWNPAGSNVNVVVEGVNANGGAAVTGVIYISDAPLANVTVNVPASKFGLAAQGKAQLRYEAGAGLVGKRTAGQYAFVASGYFEHQYRTPIVLPPGIGIYLQNSNLQNTELNAGFEWFEEPIQ